MGGHLARLDDGQREQHGGYALHITHAQHACHGHGSGHASGGRVGVGRMAAALQGRFDGGSCFVL